ncbi:MAG TPA: MmgE/PrpD family protein, partial [Burkholderiales bacterium]
MDRLSQLRGLRHGGRCDRCARRLGGGARAAAAAQSAIDFIRRIITTLTPNSSIAEQLAGAIEGARAGAPAFRDTAEKLLIDIAGLCVAARRTDYVHATLTSWEGAGTCTAIGHERALDAGGAALVNGTAAHGEDFDDTFEGGPVHAGAVIVPAVLAVSERARLQGKDALAGIAVGAELMCRASLVAPKRIHKAGFHPTAVLGALGAAAGVATALRLSEREFVNALGIVGSMASGIIEYLAEGTWTKRLHAGWA